MPVAELYRLVKSGDLAGFEKSCIEALEAGTLDLGQLVGPFKELEKSADASRVAGLGELVLENVDVTANAEAALAIARIALVADAENADLRKRVAQLYERVHSGVAGLSKLLEVSGLTTGRPARNALRLLDLCLSLRKGDPLISRSESICVEVMDIDLEHGLIVVRSEGRPRSVTIGELSREYEAISPDDFRVLRQLRPDRLRERVHAEPAAVVIELIRLHGGAVDQDTLKNELCPKLVDTKEWPKWWTGVRTQLKRSPHVSLEGRAPLLLRYNEEARTPESETWEAFSAMNDAGDWLSVFESYVREKKRTKQNPDAPLLERMCAHVAERARAAARRPAEALWLALVADRMHALAGVSSDPPEGLAATLLREIHDPAGLIAELPDADAWELALDALAATRPQDAAAYMVEALPSAPAVVIDRIVDQALAAGLGDAVQSLINTAVADPVDNAEIIFWLWKRPPRDVGLKFPDKPGLFLTIIETLSALGRTLNPPAAKMKAFRQRMKTALGLQDYAEARRCIQAVDAHRAVTLRTQLSRLEGLGDNLRSALLDHLRDAHPALWHVVREKPKPWADEDLIWTTREGLNRRVQERDHLVNVSMRENARRIGEAASHGDLSENSEYKFALEERDLLRARLAQMNHEISKCEVIDPNEVPTDHVGVGSRVRVRDTADDSTRTLVFLGPFEAAVEKGVYNYRAPFSQKLMGLQVGERVTVSLDGSEREIEILEIGSGLAHTGAAPA